MDAATAKFRELAQELNEHLQMGAMFNVEDVTINGVTVWWAGYATQEDLAEHYIEESEDGDPSKAIVRLPNIDTSRLEMISEFSLTRGIGWDLDEDGKLIIHGTLAEEVPYINAAIGWRVGELRVQYGLSDLTESVGDTAAAYIIRDLAERALRGEWVGQFRGNVVTPGLAGRVLNWSMEKAYEAVMWMADEKRLSFDGKAYTIYTTTLLKPHWQLMASSPYMGHIFKIYCPMNFNTPRKWRVKVERDGAEVGRFEIPMSSMDRQVVYAAELQEVKSAIMIWAADNLSAYIAEHGLGRKVPAW